MKRAVLLLAATLAVGCIPEEGPLMSPGEDCQVCHGGVGGEGPVWTVSGTVYARPDAAPGDGVEGARVRITDAAGKSFTLRSNQAGNFYTREGVAFPLTVSVERNGTVNEMPIPVPTGGCNSCHNVPPRNDAPGRIAAP